MQCKPEVRYSERWGFYDKPNGDIHLLADFERCENPSCALCYHDPLILGTLLKRSEVESMSAEQVWTLADGLFRLIDAHKALHKIYCWPEWTLSIDHTLTAGWGELTSIAADKEIAVKAFWRAFSAALATYALGEIRRYRPMYEFMAEYVRLLTEPDDHDVQQMKYIIDDMLYLKVESYYSIRAGLDTAIGKRRTVATKIAELKRWYKRYND